MQRPADVGGEPCGHSRNTVIFLDGYISMCVIETRMHHTLAALADPTRLRIVEFLGSSPHSVGEICDTLALGQPQASKHLRVLREARVVDVEARAQQRIYALRPAALRELSL